MPSPADKPLEGLAARKAALRILDAVLRRGQTMDNAAQAAREPAAGRCRAGQRHCRRNAAPPARSRCADRRRDAAAAARRQQGAHGAAPGAGPEDRPWHARPCAGRDRAAAGRRRPAAPGPWRARARCCARAFRQSMRRACPKRSRIAGAPPGAKTSVMAARRAIAHRPPLDLSFASEEACAAFPRRRIPRAAPPPARSPCGRSPRMPGFDDGGWWVQDLAASLPARLIPAAARRVLDACAAPGGKTMQLAAAGHEVTALDRSESRLARLSDNLARTGLKAETVVADALDWDAEEPFDAVLLDAPCSATGTFRRHPEVLYRARPGDHRAKRRAAGAAAAARRGLGEAGRKPGLCGLQPRAAGRRAADRRLPRRTPRLPARTRPARWSTA